MNLLIEDRAALPRFQPPQDAAQVEAPEDFSDALETACAVIASRAACYGQSSSQCMLARGELQMLVLIEIQRVQRFEQRRAMEAVSDALALSARGLRGAA